ncbi:MAG: sensor histidine kinase [Polaromonas sp.]|uniref:sensor histidine kinase n=1 Tax=Polaromonas sp. TaxID=1869339 RepID=UPI00403673A0
MKSVTAPTIRSRLVLLTILCMAPAFLMAALVLIYDYRQQKAELIRESVAGARSLSRLVDRELATAQVSLSVLAVSPSLQTRDHAAFQRQAQEVLKRGFINNVALIDPSGQQLMNTAIPYGQPLPVTGVMAQVQRVLQTGQAETSGLVTGAVLKRRLISVMVPVFSGQTVTHAMSGVILPEHFGKLLDSYGLPEDRITVIFDKSDTVVARSHEREQFLGKSIASGLSERLKQTSEGAFELLTLEGVPVLSSFSRSPVTGWGVAIGIPVNSLTQDLRQAMAVLLGVMALLIGLGVLGSWWMGGRIARAVRALQAPARDLGLGERIEVPPLDIREANEVGEELTRASALQQSTRKALTENETRLRSIVESAMDAIIAVDARQVILMFNAAAETMFSCPASQAIGMPLTRFIPKRFHAHNAEVFQRQEQRQRAGDPALGAAGLTDVTVGLRMSGEEFPAEVSFSSVHKSGQLLHTLIIRDVTSRVRAYKALERSNLDLQQFAYVASHDLKTPLRSIGGFVQLLERNHADKLDEKGLSLIHRTTAAVRRLEQLTEDLLSYARLEAEVRQFEPVDMGELASEVVHLLEATLQTAGASVVVHDLPRVRGDRTQLAQLMLNLVGNGIKYCRDPAPRVEISAVHQEREWVFSVKDNGIGIDPRHHDKVFEVFKRLHSQSDYPGTGIGLAICRRVVEGHGGRIWISAHAGPGATFSFTIPDDMPGHPHET